MANWAIWCTSWWANLCHICINDDGFILIIVWHHENITVTHNVLPILPIMKAPKCHELIYDIIGSINTISDNFSLKNQLPWSLSHWSSVYKTCLR